MERRSQCSGRSEVDRWTGQDKLFLFILKKNNIEKYMYKYSFYIYIYKKIKNKTKGCPPVHPVQLIEKSQ